MKGFNEVSLLDKCGIDKYIRWYIILKNIFSLTLFFLIIVHKIKHMKMSIYVNMSNS
jgi:hypothetical protein